MYGRYSLRLFVYILWAPLTANGIRGWLLFLKVIAYWEFFTSHLLGLVCGSGETDRWWLFLLLKATWIGLTLHRLIRGDRSALSSIYRRRRRRWPFCTWTILKIRLLYLDLEYRARSLEIARIWCLREGFAGRDAVESTQERASHQLQSAQFILLFKPV